VEDVIEEDDGRPKLKVLFQPTVGQFMVTGLSFGKFSPFCIFRHHAHNLLSWPLASYSALKEN
jgi:hypothetical protein